MDIPQIINLMSKIPSINHRVDGSINKQEGSQTLWYLSPSNEYPKKNISLSCVPEEIKLLFHLRDCLLRQSDDPRDIILSVTQCCTVSKCIDVVISMGFIPCLIPSVWKSFDYKQKTAIEFVEDSSLVTKYEELKFYVNSFFDLIKEPTLKRLIMVKYTNVLLAGLSQLCLLPIGKPGTKSAVENAIDKLRYEELINEQKKFKTILKKLILTDRDPLVIREIIFLLTHENVQNHIRLGLGELVSDLLIQSNGVQTILGVDIDSTISSSINFNECSIEEWSNIIHDCYRQSKTGYSKYIIPQIWKLLRSNKMNHHQYRSIAVSCINLLYKENYNTFLIHFMNPLEQSMKKNAFLKDENATVSQCIEDLHTLFYVFRNEIWSLKPKLLIQFASTIYNIYTATALDLYYLKFKLEDLVYLILIQFSNCKEHLKLIIFSQYRIDVEYVDDGANMRINCVVREDQSSLQSQLGLILDMMDKRNDLKLMKTIFISFMEMFIDFYSNEYSTMEKWFILKAILHLIKLDDVKKSLSTDPKIVLNMIASFLNEMSDENNIIDNQTLTIILVVLECVLDDINKAYTEKLDCLVELLSKIFKKLEDVELKDTVQAIQQQIQQIQKSTSVKKPVENKRTIDDILCDIRDPLLPCSAHVLIELKKCIEFRDKTVLVKKSDILITIQENLKNVDSYIYLSAIFTLSSLCSYCPNDILPILCEQYSMPTNYNHSPEIRLKIGEAVMKTIRSLSDTIPVYKNILINTFMAGVGDNDHLVRASSLSNLSDVCRLLHYNLGSIIAEIVNCADNVIQFDPALVPRRAAILLLHMIIKGCDSELLETLGDKIKDIYQMLKFQYQNNKDMATKTNAQDALEKLNDTMNSLFLDKTIK